jgi:poly-gamma-glutamate system protein
MSPTIDPRSWRRHRPDLGDGPLRRRIVLAGGFGLLVWGVVALLPAFGSGEGRLLTGAFQRMEEGLTLVAAHRSRSGPSLEAAVDPNRTGLVGPEVGELTTSLGSLEAKRTAASPEMAALIAHLLRRAGVGRGDVVAIGASGSFPGLLLAALSAASVLGARPITILSLGASTWGATSASFDLLDLHRLFESGGLAPGPPVLVTAGGGEDTGGGLEAGEWERLREQVRRSGLPWLEEPDLRRNTARRMEVYEEAAGPDRVAAFVNIGGSFVNLGTSRLALELRPGLNTRVVLPPEEERGVLHEMAARGRPVIHLLNLRGLASRYGLAWDPVPLPRAGTSRFLRTRSRPPLTVTLLTVLFLALVGVLLFPRKIEGRGGASGDADTL